MRGTDEGALVKGQRQSDGMQTETVRRGGVSVGSQDGPDAAR